MNHPSKGEWKKVSSQDSKMNLTNRLFANPFSIHPYRIFTLFEGDSPLRVTHSRFKKCECKGEIRASPLSNIHPFWGWLTLKGHLFTLRKRAKFGPKLARIQIVQANYEPLTTLNNWLRSIMLFSFLTRMQNRNKNNIYVGLNMEKYYICFSVSVYSRSN